MIGNWKKPIRGPPLVQQWKIKIIKFWGKFAGTPQLVESGRSDEISIRIHSNVYIELEKNARNYLTSKKGNRNQVSHHKR